MEITSILYTIFNIYKRNYFIFCCVIVMSVISSVSYSIANNNSSSTDACLNILVLLTRQSIYFSLMFGQNSKLASGLSQYLVVWSCKIYWFLAESFNAFTWMYVSILSNFCFYQHVVDHAYSKYDRDNRTANLYLFLKYSFHDSKK